MLLNACHSQNYASITINLTFVCPIAHTIMIHTCTLSSALFHCGAIYLFSVVHSNLIGIFKYSLLLYRVNFDKDVCYNFIYATLAAMKRTLFYCCKMSETWSVATPVASGIT